MKTIKEAAKSPEFNRALLLSNPHQVITKSFESGVKFAQRWISIDDELPEIKNERYQIFIKRAFKIDPYEVFSISPLIKSKENLIEIFSEFSVTHWRPIELK